MALALMMILFLITDGINSHFPNERDPGQDVPASQTSAPATDRAAWDALNADQMSWVIEGIQERMSELSDDLHYAQHLQAEKLNAE